MTRLELSRWIVAASMIGFLPSWSPDPTGRSLQPASLPMLTQAKCGELESKSGRVAVGRHLESIAGVGEHGLREGSGSHSYLSDDSVRVAQVAEDKNVSIAYYGVCLDQNKAPIEGVIVNLSVRQWHGAGRLDLGGSVKKLTAVSDKSGRFHLTGVKGDVVSIEQAVKTGYEWVRNGRQAVNYWSQKDLIPTSEAPAVLCFWRQQGAEMMYRYASSDNLLTLWLECNGTPQGFDLHSGARVTENPDVRFAFERVPVTLPLQFKGRYDWKLTVEIMGGRIQVTETNAPFLAPETGYRESATIDRKAGDPNWTRDGKAQFYFVTPRREYGRLEVEVVTHMEAPRTRFSWTVHLNPSGSRNLEFLPSKRLDPVMLLDGRPRRNLPRLP